MSTDVATLVLAVDANAVKQGGTELDKLTEKGTRAEVQTKKLTTASDELRKIYASVAKAFAAWQIAGFIKDSALMAARFETLGIVMKIAGNNAGYTRAEVEKYSKELQAQGISMMQSRDAVIQLATANIDLAKASDLGRAAQDLAVVANINSSDAMLRMIHGIKSGEQEILKTMGMQISWEASYKKLAAQVGTTSDKLTEQQKVMARTNAVLEESVKYQGIYEEAMGTAGKAMSSLTRHWDNFKIKVGEIFLPALSDSVDTLTVALKAANEELDKAGAEGMISNIGEGLSKAFRTVKEAVLVLGANVAYVFATIGREIGGIAAQANALVTGGGFKAALAIRTEMLADNAAAAKALSAFETSVMNPKPSAPKTSAMSEEERIRQGNAARAKAAAEALTLGNKTGRGGGGASAVDKEATAYSNLARSIREKTSAAILEGDGQNKLTDGQKTAAKFAEDLAMGELKLTAAHRASIVVLLEKQIAVEKQNQQAKAYAEALNSIRESVVTADDATRDLNTAQKVLLDLMRAPEWENMPDVWKQTAIEATAAATAELKVLEIRREMDYLIANTDTAKLEKQREQMQRIADAYLDNKFGIEGSEAAMKQYAEVVDVALGRNATSLEKEADALDEFTKSAAQNMQKALADFLFDPFAAGTKGMLQSFGTMIRQMISQAVAADLMNRLFGDMGKTGDVGGWVGNALSSLSGLGGNASFPGFGDTAGLAAGVPQFAVGIDYVPRDMVAQVHKGEKIVPASENKQNKPSGNVYNMSVHVPPGTPSETRRAAGIGAREVLSAFSNAQRYA